VSCGLNKLGPVPGTGSRWLRGVYDPPWACGGFRGYCGVSRGLPLVGLELLLVYHDPPAPPTLPTGCNCPRGSQPTVHGDDPTLVVILIKTQSIVKTGIVFVIINND